MKTLLTLAAICFTLSTSFAQQVVSVKEFLAAQKTQQGALALGTSSTSSKSAVESMLYDVQPSIVLRNHQKQVTGNTPAIVLSTDAASLSFIATMPDRPAKVAVLEVRIRTKQDLQSAMITSAMLEKISNVQYIIFKSDVPCTATEIKKLVPATLSGITVLYDVQQTS
ncbi:MAG: hypothetical protein LCH58_14475 [Bacteroidetes bacterium]|uniref:hypothetical protein n=1 Tax=Phnomibacter sp. TaxID=2836217 RepID=UPI002FDE64F3|nr:hypothetical protein [Bacteroidota bacterium]